MSEQQQDETTKVACLRCGGWMVECRLDIREAYHVEAIPVGSEQKTFNKHKSPVRAMACYSCGHMEMFAIQPGELDPARWNH